MAPLPGPAAPHPHPPRLLLLPAAGAAAPPSSPLHPPPPPRKRQRLAHLSAEEKALRRKLKNRVAAQSARDRKKARMGELERQAVELEAENQKLLAENQALRERTLGLAAENRELRLRLGLPATEPPPPPPPLPPAPAAKVEASWDGARGEEEDEEQQQLEEEEEEAASSDGEEVEQGQAQQSPPLWPASAWILTAALALSLISSWAFWTAWTQTCFCTTAARSKWRRRRRSVQETQVPYQPLLASLWGPHCPSWKPLMN